MDSDEYYEDSHDDEMLEDYYEEEEDTGANDVVVAAPDSINLALAVLTTVFLIIGIGLVSWELSGMYEWFGSK